MGQLPVVTGEDFEQAVLRRQGITLVEFYTPQCVPCRKLEPLLTRLPTQFPDIVEVVKVDASVDTGLAEQYGIMGSPTLLLFAEGQLKGEKRGFVVLTELSNWVKANLGQPANPPSN